MLEPLIQIIEKHGVIGIIILIFYLLLKVKPITLATSTDIEQNFLSKEKRVSRRAFNFIIEILIFSIIQTIVTGVFLSSKNGIHFHEYIVFLLTIFIGLCSSFFLHFYNKKLNVFLLAKERGKENILEIIYFLYLLSCTLLPSYIMAYIVATNLPPTINLETSYYKILLSCFIIYFASSLFLFHPIRRVLPNRSDYHGERRIFIELDGVKWYIFHPIDDDYFFLGNTSKSEQSTEFKFIKKDDLFKMIIKIEFIR